MYTRVASNGQHGRVLRKTAGNLVPRSLRPPTVPSVVVTVLVGLSMLV